MIQQKLKATGLQGKFYGFLLTLGIQWFKAFDPMGISPQRGILRADTSPGYFGDQGSGVSMETGGRSKSFAISIGLLMVICRIEDESQSFKST